MLEKSGFTYRACGPLTKSKERIFKENLKKQEEIHDIFIKMNWIKFVFNMAWLMERFQIFN